MEIVGITNSSFTAKDTGKLITGFNIHCMEEIAPEKGEGFSVERIYMSSDKLMMGDYVPKVGDKVKPEYNRFGKVAALHLQK